MSIEASISGNIINIAESIEKSQSPSETVKLFNSFNDLTNNGKNLPTGCEEAARKIINQGLLASISLDCENKNNLTSSRTINFISDKSSQLILVISTVAFSTLLSWYLDIPSPFSVGVMSGVIAYLGVFVLDKFINPVNTLNIEKQNGSKSQDILLELLLKLSNQRRQTVEDLAKISFYDQQNLQNAKDPTKKYPLSTLKDTIHSLPPVTNDSSDNEDPEFVLAINKSTHLANIESKIRNFTTTDDDYCCIDKDKLNKYVLIIEILTGKKTLDKENLKTLLSLGFGIEIQTSFDDIFNPSDLDIKNISEKFSIFKDLIQNGPKSEKDRIIRFQEYVDDYNRRIKVYKLYNFG